MKKITLLLLAGMAAFSNAYSQAPTCAAVDPSTLVQQHSAQRQSQTQSVLSVFPNFGWSNKPALPGGRWATGPTFSKNCIAGTDTGLVYLIAGYDAAFANTNVTTVYNTTTGLYRSLAPIPATRGQVSSFTVGQKIYVIGGYGASSFVPVSTNSIYDIPTNTWTTGAPMPVAVGDYAAGVYKDSLIYYISGYNGSADVNNVQIYNTYTNTWTVGTPRIGTAVAGCRLGISGNNIVFVGGYSQSLGAELAAAYLGVINPTSPTTITWSALPNYPGGTVGRLAGGVSFENDNRVYFGGGDPTGQGISTLNSVYAYNTTTSAWDSGPNMPVSVSNIVSLAGVVNNDSLFLVTMGGYDGSVITTTNSWLNLGHAAPLPTVQNSTSTCAGTSVTLNAYNALTYSWTPFSSLNNASISNPTASPSSTTTYTVTMTKKYGCPVVGTVTLTVNPLPTVVANTTATTVCAGSPVTLSGSGAVTYTWDNSVVNNVPFNAMTTMTYMVTGTDANGCSDMDMITINVNQLPIVTANSTASAVCDGSPVTLTGGGATSYTWTGSVSDNVPFTPIATATYTVTGTDGNGCSNTAMTTVTVNPLPTVVANASSSSVCDGSQVTLSGSGATSYTWTGSVTDNVPFTPAATATYTVTGTDANGCTNTDMTTVTVNPVPTVVANASATTVCFGTNVTLSGSGATSYAWTGNVTDNVPFMPNATATYTVTGTDGNGCSGTDMITVTVNSVPDVIASASPSSTVCAGTAVTLSGSGASTYTWTGNVMNNVAFTPTSTNTYTVTGTDGNGCSDSDVITVTVNPLPNVTVSLPQNTMCVDDANLVLSGGSPASGTWSGTGVSGGSFDPSVTGAGTQTVTYSYTDVNGCSGSAPATITVNLCTGITEAIAQNGIAIYPNPNDGQFTIQLAVSPAAPVQVEVTNGLGQIVNAFTMTDNSKQVDISLLDKGVYFVRVINGNEVSVQRVVKQ